MRENPREGVNVCTGYGHSAVAHDKLLKLARGITRSMHYNPRSEKTKTERACTLQSTFAALSRLTLDEVFDALDGGG
jgi:hypothetical protein